jgi:DNA-directed RNA polymerase specialized sigma24 family protein
MKNRKSGEEFLLAFRRLPELNRKIAFELFFADATISEAATRYGRSPDDAIKLFQAALKQLRRDLPGLK